jgi:hypothetical protein
MTAKQFLIEKGIKSIREQISVHTVQKWLEEFAAIKEPKALEKPEKSQKPVKQVFTKIQLDTAENFSGFIGKKEIFICQVGFIFFGKNRFNVEIWDEKGARIYDYEIRCLDISEAKLRAIDMSEDKDDAFWGGRLTPKK